MIQPFRAVVFALCCLALALAVGPAHAESRQPTLVPGRWEITWIEPRFTPAVKAFETRITRCYSAADAARGANIVMPQVQEQRCKTSSQLIGGDVTFDTACADGDHRLRVFFCGTGLCGVYRYVPHGKRAILESIVFLRRVDRPCEQS